MALIGNREFRNQTVTINELTVVEQVIDGYTFSNCKILGPAVVALQGSVEITHCSFDADANALFWEVPPTREYVIGAILITNCVFSGCAFHNVGFAGTPEMRALFESGLGFRN